MTSHTRKWVGRAVLSLVLGVLLSGLLSRWADRPLRGNLQAYLIFDTSESIGDALFGDLKRTSSSLVRELELGDSFMLVEVFEDAYVHYKHVRGGAEGPLRTEEDLATALQKVETLRIRWGYQGTRLDKALEIVSKEMHQSPPDPREPCFLIVATDGAPDCAPQFGNYEFPDQTLLCILGNRHPGLLDELESMGLNAVVSTDEADSLQASTQDLLLGMAAGHRNSLLVRSVVWVLAAAILALFLLGAGFCVMEARYPLCGVLTARGRNPDTFDLASDERRYRPWWRFLHPRRCVTIGSGTAEWLRPGFDVIIGSNTRGVTIQSANGSQIGVDSVTSLDGRPLLIHRHNRYREVKHLVDIGDEQYVYIYQPPS